MYHRDLQQELLQLSKQWSVISVTGPRQSGKTTLCKMAFPNYKYVNLEHIPTLEIVKKEPDTFLEQYKDGLIIDEAQNFPDIFSYIQVKVDEDKSCRFVLTGSSDFLLMKNITQSMAGRVAVKRLLPLSIHEIGDLSKYSTDEIMFRGFYPNVWADGKEPCYVYESYYTTYLERDVRQINEIKNLSEFRTFVTLAAGRVGTEFNASSLGNEIGVSSVTVSSWMNILEASYTAFRLYPYFKNLGKRLTKTPKIFFYDVGLVCWLLGIRDAHDLSTHPLRGSIFENMVVVEMMKQKFHQRGDFNLYYYRDKSQREVDIIKEETQRISGYEVKSAITFHPDFQKNLDYLKGILGDSMTESRVIYNGETMPFGATNFREFFK